ncbi:MAG: esterase/lipase family protein [Victivallaceae bacterium]
MLNFCRLLWLPLLIFLAGCASDIHLAKGDVMSSQLNYIPLAENPDDLALETTNYLRSTLLMDDFKDSPDPVIARLHAELKRTRDRKIVEVLTDINYHLGKKSSNPDLAVRYFVSSALYAYMYLFDGELHPKEIERFDPMNFVMSRYYNNSLVRIFLYLQDKKLLGKSSFALTDTLGRRVLFETPLYPMAAAANPDNHLYLCSAFVPKNALQLSRKFGIGVPLIVEIGKTTTDVEPMRSFAGQTYPCTFIVRFKGLADGSFQATPEFLDPHRTDDVAINPANPAVPVEQDFTTPLVYLMKPRSLFENIAYMVNADKMSSMEGLFELTPYDPDKIPVLLVHGLMSHPRTWTQLVNSLLSDPRIRKHYQFWLFSYSTGNPIFFSARKLRLALLECQKKFDPKGKNKAFEEMIIIGHSMGGLLTHAVVSDCNTTTIDKIAGRPYQEFKDKLSPDERRMLEETFNFKQLPFVSRVIFMATPHRGSPMAQASIARFGISLIRLPADIVTLNTTRERLRLPLPRTGITGIDNLNPESPALCELATFPVPPPRRYHSIIGNEDAAGVPGGTDGIVPYTSSHLDGAVSELVVKSGHNVQESAVAISEVHRILLEHLIELKLLPPKN